MRELKAKVIALLGTGLGDEMLAELLIDVVARGLGKLGGRPAKEPVQACAPTATPVDASDSLKFEVSEPVSTPRETSNLSVCNSGSDLVLASPEASQKSLSNRRRDEPMPPGFGDFWALFPRRVGKQDAEKSWRKQKPDPELVRTALIWQIEAWDAESPPRPIDKIPHPATWLNGRRWEDEKPAPRGTNGGNGAPPASRRQAEQEAAMRALVRVPGGQHR